MEPSGTRLAVRRVGLGELYRTVRAQLSPPLAPRSSDTRNCNSAAATAEVARVAVPLVPHRQTGHGRCGCRDGGPGEGHAGSRGRRFDQELLHDGLGYHRHFTVAGFLDYVAILKEITDRRRRAEEVARVLAAIGLEDRARTRIRAHALTARNNAASSRSNAPGVMPAAARKVPCTLCRACRPVRFPPFMTNWSGGSSRPVAGPAGSAQDRNAAYMIAVIRSIISAFGRCTSTALIR
jgi:hypothetical protein